MKEMKEDEIVKVTIKTVNDFSMTDDAGKDIDIAKQRMRSLANQFEDMPKGTTSSILSNKYIPRRNAMMNDKDMTFRTDRVSTGLFLNDQDRVEF